jgi:hypothetical protein
MDVINRTAKFTFRNQLKIHLYRNCYRLASHGAVNGKTCCRFIQNLAVWKYPSGGVLVGCVENNA